MTRRLQAGTSSIGQTWTRQVSTHPTNWSPSSRPLPLPCHPRRAPSGARFMTGWFCDRTQALRERGGGP